MKNLLVPVLLFFGMLCGWNCQQRAASFSEDELKISVSTICGWCAGGDSLLITASSTVYRHTFGCNEKTETIRAKTEKADWDALIASLDRDAFEKIDLNICNVCADGCDIRATVREKKFAHTISYGNIDNEAVAEVRPFLKVLESMLGQFRAQNQ
ncbi:hypothetical protein ABDK00_008090 [Niabella insulamsoli]|uniref:hypothetical protein n=1 Tax=Niabella insulamsoli TaxID=3144874 RepID=UPI0031FBA6FF